MSRPARARIDLGALRHNFARARSAAGGSRIIAVIKANAYGHGVLPAAEVLADADAFAVASIEEALVLRDAGVDKRILLLAGIFDPAELDEAASRRLDLVVHDAWQVAALQSWRGAGRFDAWLKIDTGMHRLGVAAADVPVHAGALRALPCVRVVRLMTHLACADEPDSPHAAAQLAAMERACDGFDGEVCVANSAGLLGWPAARCDWVRPGIMLYGSSPFVGGDADRDGLRPVMHLESKIIAVRDLPRGECIGYGASYTAEKDLRMGVVALGYADGYPRRLGTGTPVLVDGRRTRLLGRVSMDLITLDLTGIPGAAVGSAVRFWGEGLPADEIAAAAGTIAYELFTGVNARVRREYLSA